MEKRTKNLLKEGELLPLMEAFYTIQGEGRHVGSAAYFIRIGGCDVGCHWCDVKESWNSDLHPLTNTQQIIEQAMGYSRIVVVTGGEPLMWNLDKLTQGLAYHGLQTHLETSGAYRFSGAWDWVCLSPKKVQPPLETSYARADELKCIVHNKNDLDFAREQAKYVNENCILYLQPEWSVRHKMIPWIVDFVQNHPEWKISVQAHKYLKIP